MRLRFYALATYLLLLVTLIAAAGRQKAEETVQRSEPRNNTVSVAGSKVAYPKKVISLKKRPTKSSAVATPTGKPRKPADVTLAFKDLPEDDFEFIKELDKQFKLHGDKIKFKVEQENATNPKNAKRTIEGELGYGYEHNGYEYPRPKFEFYPYSQQDISSDAPGYYPTYEKTSVSIQPSHSYELQSQTYVPQTEEQPQLDLPHGQQQHQQQHYEEPVIVLRIPGPTKYASHLQALLQQYLQIRATQYLHILEEAELRKNQHFEAGQQYEQQPEAHVDYEQPAAYEQPPLEQPDYHQDVAYAHQIAPTPQPVHYPDIDEVYHGYEGRHSIQQEQQQQQQQHQVEQEAYYNEAQVYHAQAQAQAQAHAQQQQLQLPQYYYMGAQGHATGDYQQLYLVGMASGGAYQQHEQLTAPIYAQEEETQSPLQAHELAQTHIGENSPRDSHTKVLFTPHNEQPAEDYVPMYELPSIRPYDRHAPIRQQQQHYQAQEGAAHLEYEQQASQQNTVAITQPHNYHAHGIKPQARGRKRGAAPSSTTSAPQNTASTPTVSVTHNEHKTEQQLRKIRAYVRENLGAEMGTAVEFKTTQVVQG